MRHWRATCGENRMRRSEGGRRKRVRTSGNLAGGLPCGGSVISSVRGDEESLNSGAIDETTLYWAERRVLDHQRKLHRWARNEPRKRFGDLFNLVCDQSTLLVAWERVAGNRGARTAGVDAVTRRHVEEDIGVLPFLQELRSSLKDGSFRALPVRQVAIPKKSGKLRLLGIPTRVAYCAAPQAC
jgi:hypothetical protein